MKREVLQTIREHNLLEPDMHIVIGLSGGPDSVCMFDILRELCREMKWTLYPVHINHKLRPGAAEEDQQYVEQMCRKWGIDCHTVIKDCSEMAQKLGKTCEEAGRILRYEAFSTVAAKVEEKGIAKERIAIAVAHNADDQCETLLFRILRGTGTDGLVGIPYKRFDRRGFAIVRPLLDVKRKSIEKYCCEKNLEPRLDHTNKENLYTRNRIRNLLIPCIEENFNTNIVDTVNRMAKIASRDKDYLWQQTQQAYEESLCSYIWNEKDKTPRVRLSGTKLQSLHKAIRLRVYSKALGIIGMTEDLTFAQLEAVDAILFSTSPSASVNMAKGFMAAREYDKLAFYYKYQTLNQEAEWKLLQMTADEYRRYMEKGILHGAFSGIDLLALEIRGREPGDRIELEIGVKKLQDFLIDEKVPKDYRDSIQVLARGKDVLWILPSEAFPRENLKNKGRFSVAFKADLRGKKPVIVLERVTKI